jgi:DNA-binding transcriptional ArsR family regulator
MSERRPVETVDPEDAFAALADDTRVDILRALWDTEEQRATFSELREAVGMRDSGQFNYHLDKLVGRFVRKTDDGYELTLAGMSVNGAIEAGAYTMDGQLDPVDLEEPCPVCGGDRTFSYEDEEALVTCADCSFGLGAPVPPGVFVDCTPEEAPDVASRYFRAIVRQVADGFCWHCEGPVALSVQPLATTGDGDPPADVADVPIARFECERCGNVITSDLGSAFVDHPAVAGFYFDRGVDVREHPFETFDTLVPDRSEIRERDPFRASVTFPADGETVTLVVDGDGEVVAVERSDE